MLTVVLSLLLGAASFLGVFYFFGAIEAVLPAIAAVLITFFLLSRFWSKKLERQMLMAQKEIQKGRFERGIAMMEELKREIGPWQLFAKSTLDGQIGSIHFLRKEFDRAKPYLEAAFVRHWLAKAMLGVLYFRKKEYAQMDKVFKEATRYSQKQGLLWSVWAYCHWKAGNTQKAIEVLVAAQKKLNDQDPRIVANLQNLQNQKKMKMRGYGEQWYHFHLEVPPQMRAMQNQRVRYVQR